jgi:hypothetical protein
MTEPIAPKTAKVTVISLWSKRAGQAVPPAYDVEVSRCPDPVETLNLAWVLTNRDDRPKAKEVCSTSAGDIMVLDGRHYFVDLTGFQPMTQAQSEAVQTLSSQDTGMGWDWLLVHHLIPNA